ncbi:MAG: prepilin-type N-terminal cleavage/methylation domain-containing protein [Polyangiaceae bacterium]|nr:prepilin-type N-terminal cleavage/methylation domain-containing protein [Polyangiaceae bacterium]
MSTPPSFQTSFARRRQRRGFTLVELMVAVTGGLFVSLAVFAISRQSGRFYTRESRVSDATLGALVGFERLKADVARAGFLSSPNVGADPNLCGTPTAYPFMLRRLASVRIRPGQSPAALSQHMIDNGRTPDELMVMGSYTGAEVFPIWNIATVGNQYIVYLQSQTGPLGRMGYAASANQQAMLEGIFGAARGRGLRIQDQSGEVQYATISGVSTVGSPQVILENQPSLIFRQGAGTLCGLKGNVTGAVVNVVNFVRYDLRNIQANASYATAYTSGGHPYDATTRFDLVRAEVDTAGTLIAGTEELISEYAVDLKLGITHADNAVPSTTDQTLQVFPATNAALISARAGDLVGDIANPSNGPQRVRAVRLRLSVRSQDPDRDTSPPTPLPGQLFRVGLGPSAGAPFARVRTIQADVALNNQTAVFY